MDPTIAACEQGLKRLLHTRHADVLMYAANGHGAWEAVIANLLGAGRSALIPGTGHFSESWAIQAEALGAKVIRTPWVEGLPIDVGAVEQALRDDKQHEIVAVFCVHTDTASGVTSELRLLRKAIDAVGHPALFVVDVVASLGVVPFDMDVLRADVVIGASQKGLMLPPGLGFVAVNQRAVASAETNPAPRFYWDSGRRRDALSYRKFCGTPPINLLFGMQAALQLIFHEGLDAVFARHKLLAGAVHAAVQGWSEGGALSFFCQPPECRSFSRTRQWRCEPVSTPRRCARWRASASRYRCPVWPGPAGRSRVPHRPHGRHQCRDGVGRAGRRGGRAACAGHSDRQGGVQRAVEVLARG